MRERLSGKRENRGRGGREKKRREKGERVGRGEREKGERGSEKEGGKKTLGAWGGDEDESWREGGREEVKVEERMSYFANM